MPNSASASLAGLPRATATSQLLRLASKQRVFGERARRDEAGDVAAHQRLGAALARLGRVLDLLADRDAVAERDQAVQVILGALDRHAAHRDIAAEMLAALGQHDAERAAGGFGVAEEHFVEIAHPVKKQAIGIGGFDLDILLHHRRDARRGLGLRTGIGRRCCAFEIHATTLADGWSAFIGPASLSNSPTLR